jgi:hypothetical protein
MSAGVVHGLEVVDVQDGHAEQGTGPVCALDRHLQPGVQATAVGQAGQRVGVGGGGDPQQPAAAQRDDDRGAADDQGREGAGGSQAAHRDAARDQGARGSRSRAG